MVKPKSLLALVKEASLLYKVTKASEATINISIAQFRYEVKLLVDIAMCETPSQASLR